MNTCMDSRKIRLLLWSGCSAVGHDDDHRRDFALRDDQGYRDRELDD